MARTTYGLIVAGNDAERTSDAANAACVERDADVAGSGEPHAAAERRAVHAGDGRLGSVDSVRSSAASACASARFSSRRGRALALHPVQVGAGARSSCRGRPARRRARASSASSVGQRLRSDSAISVSSKALCSSGRFSHSQAAAPRRSISSVVVVGSCAASHPEHAELRRLDRRVQRGGERQRQHARVSRRVDDAVVPQPRGGVVGVALRLVLLADRRLERLLLLGAPRARPWPRCRRAGPWRARSPPARRPSREMRAFGHIHRKRGRVGAAAHAVVAGAEAAADDAR